MKKNISIKVLVFFSLVLFVFASCNKTNEDFAVGQNEQINKQKEQQERLENSLTEANKIISAKEKQRILAYAQRRNIALEEYSGVFYQITCKGKGANITNDNNITIRYNCKYLNGSSLNEGADMDTLSFKVGGDTQVAFGLKTAVKQMSKETKALVIVPDNLAFWLDDNGEKQEANATLVYEIEILKVE